MPGKTVSWRVPAGAAAALALAGALAGCAAAGATESLVSPDTTIEMIAESQGSAFSLSMECGAAQEARKLGISLVTVAPQQFTVAQQRPLVQGVIVGNPDALIISPASSASLHQAVAAGASLSQDLYVVQENDTKVIFADTSIDDNTLGASRVTSDNTAGGRAAADSLGRLLGGTGSVAVLTAPDGGSPAGTRIRAFRDEMASRYPGITVLGTQDDAAGSAADAASLVAGDIKAHHDLAGVLAMTQDAARGAESAIAQAGMTGRVKLGTFDAGPFQMTGLLTGAIALTVAQDPAAEGADAVDQAVSAVAGTKVQAHVYTPMIAITRQNMNAAAVKPYIYDGTCVQSLRGYMTSGS
jgi:ribose transport system substrate-binding protein